MKKLLLPSLLLLACAATAADSSGRSALETILDAGRDYGEHRAREERREKREERRDKREDRDRNHRHRDEKDHHNRHDDKHRHHR